MKYLFYLLFFLIFSDCYKSDYKTGQLSGDWIIVQGTGLTPLLPDTDTVSFCGVMMCAGTGCIKPSNYCNAIDISPDGSILSYPNINIPSQQLFEIEIHWINESRFIAKDISFGTNSCEYLRID